MKKRKLLLIILGVEIILRIGLHQLCKMMAKPFTNHSSTLIESKSNNFLIEDYQLVEIGEVENEDLKREFNLTSIFLENNWDLKCSFWRLAKVPTKVNGQNIVLPMRVQNLESLDKFRFYLVTENDTITLRGNYTVQTSYYHKTWGSFKELSNSELLIKDKKGILPTRRFKIEKEKN